HVRRDHHIAATLPDMRGHGAVMTPEVQRARERPVDLHEALGHAVGNLMDQEGMVLEIGRCPFPVAPDRAPVEDAEVPAAGVTAGSAAASVVLLIVLGHTWPYGIYRRTGKGPRRVVPDAAHPYGARNGAAFHG